MQWPNRPRAAGDFVPGPFPIKDIYPQREQREKGELCRVMLQFPSLLRESYLRRDYFGIHIAKTSAELRKLKRGCGKSEEF